jgi:hypothetical protein
MKRFLYTTTATFSRDAAAGDADRPRLNKSKATKQNRPSKQKSGKRPRLKPRKRSSGKPQHKNALNDDANPPSKPAEKLVSLLVERSAAQKMLCNVSVTTMLRWEKSGSLTPIKPSGPNGRVFYAHCELLALVNGQRRHVAE